MLLTLDALLTRYEQDFLPLKAPQTQLQQRTVFKTIRADLGTLLLSDLTPARLRDWRNTLLARYPTGTARRYLYLLSGPLTAAVKEYEVLAENPLRKVRFPSPGPGRMRILTAPERHQLLLTCQESRNPALYLLVLLALTTGARRNELRYLRWRDIDLERGILTFPQTKNGTPRRVPVVAQALTVLRGWRLRDRAPDAWVFPRRDLGGPVHIAIAFRGAVRRAGLANFRFHDLRHCAASYLAMSGASLLEIAEILGHKSLAMVKRYAHLTETHVRTVVERMADTFLTDPSEPSA
jgi:integrase